MPYRVSPPVLPLTETDVEEENPLSGKFLKYMPSSFSSGCFIAAITREVHQRTFVAFTYFCDIFGSGTDLISSLVFLVVVLVGATSLKSLFKSDWVENFQNYSSSKYPSIDADGF